jgi:carbohydrate-binding DOMON domain-containing protein
MPRPQRSLTTGFRVWCLGFRVQVLGFRVEGLRRATPRPQSMAKHTRTHNHTHTHTHTQTHTHTHTLSHVHTQPRNAMDDEYVRAGEVDPRVMITTSRDPSSRLVQVFYIFVDFSSIRARA